MQRRCYWLLEESRGWLVFVHYLKAGPSRKLITPEPALRHQSNGEHRWTNLMQATARMADFGQSRTLPDDERVRNGAPQMMNVQPVQNNSNAGLHTS